MSRLHIGANIPDTTFYTIQGDSITVPYKDTPLLHIQFRRYAGCPICNLHMRSVMKRYDEIKASGISELVFFHSSAAEMMPHLANLPFGCVADPVKTHYKSFGVETSLCGELNPKNIVAVLKGLQIIDPRLLLKKPENGRRGMPADFLINRDGLILDLKYGNFADDQWSVDELVAKAKAVI
ncbi:MAG: redoxin domain-containing protein [Deltaproteobacteria bacterium]|nr:redoxin domain-containing protein [Deltaproteobacteria bacterium]